MPSPRRHRGGLAPPWVSALAALALFAGWSLARPPSGALARARGLESRVVAALRRLRPSVVSLRVKLGKTGGLSPQDSSGSGVIVRQDGMILTNDHVVAGAELIEVQLSDGRILTAVVHARDAVGDLALLKVAAAGLAALEPADTRGLAVGAPVLTYGNAQGLALANAEPAATFGVVTAVHRYQGGRRIYGDAIQFDAPVNPGNSGGGLFGLDGSFLGITGRISVRGNRSANSGVGYAIPGHQIALALPSLLAGEDVVHGYLGIRFERQSFGPVIIRQVLPGSAAEKAGLRSGDVILEVDGQAIDHSMRLQNSLSIRAAGARVRLKTRRGLQDRQVEVELGAPRRAR